MILTFSALYTVQSLCAHTRVCVCVCVDRERESVTRHWGHCVWVSIIRLNSSVIVHTGSDSTKTKRSQGENECKCVRQTARLCRTAWVMTDGLVYWSQLSEIWHCPIPVLSVTTGPRHSGCMTCLTCLIGSPFLFPAFQHHCIIRTTTHRQIRI